MVLRRCSQCKGTTDDKYGFCIKCGYEFPKSTIGDDVKVCIKCGRENPKDAKHCVRCGTPLDMDELFKNYELVLQPTKPKKSEVYAPLTTTNKILLVFGYLFAILGGIIGLIFAIYFITRKNPTLRKHGIIQLAILVIYVIIISILILTGQLDVNTMFNNYTQMMAGNATNLNNFSYFRL